MNTKGPEPPFTSKSTTGPGQFLRSWSGLFQAFSFCYCSSLVPPEDTAGLSTAVVGEAIPAAGDGVAFPEVAAGVDSREEAAAFRAVEAASAEEAPGQAGDMKARDFLS